MHVGYIQFVYVTMFIIHKNNTKNQMWFSQMYKGEKQNIVSQYFEKYMYCELDILQLYNYNTHDVVLRSLLLNHNFIQDYHKPHMK